MEVVIPTDNVVEDNDDAEHSPNIVKPLHHLSLLYFRSKLIEHFDILFKRNAIVWPSQCSVNNN
jgi:hypothetical protein